MVKMNFTFVPTLEHAALVKTAVILWNQDNIRRLLSTFDFQSSDQLSKQNEWQKIEDMVAEKVPELKLAVPLDEKLRGIIEAVGLQILNWQQYHIITGKNITSTDFPGLHIPTCFSWTVQGKINYKETAKQLIKDENMDIVKRYELACINCLEEDIRMLWNRLPETLRNVLYDVELPSRNPIVIYWSVILIAEMAPHTPELVEILGEALSLQAFEHAAVESFNIVATKYLFHKLPRAGRRIATDFVAITILHKIRHSICAYSVVFIEEYSNILLFLLSQMDREQQMKIIRVYALEILFCYLTWPMQRLFVEAADQLWDLLDVKKYILILMAICKRVTVGMKNHNYKELLHNFWQHSPDRFVINIINNCGKKEFSLARLYKYGDRSLLKLFLKDLPDDQKKKMLKVTQIWENLILQGDWLTVAILLEECVTSKDAILQFRKEMEERLMLLQHEKRLEENVCIQFSELLDKLGKKY